MKTFNNNGSSINLVSSSGPYVILVHGLGLNKEMWEWQTNELSKNFSVVTYDLIGHGGSKDPEGKLNLEKFSEQILEIMNFLSIKKTALIGFSLGGMIARKFAIKYSEKLWALAVLNSAHRRDQKAKDAVQIRVNKVKIDGPQATTEDALNRWFTEEYRQNNFKVSGCQAQVWLVPYFENKLLSFYTDSDAFISKGMITILSDIYGGNLPEDIFNANFKLIEKLNLEILLTPGRNNGVYAMLKKIKDYAKTFSKL